MSGSTMPSDSIVCSLKLMPENIDKPTTLPPLRIESYDDDAELESGRSMYLKRSAPGVTCDAKIRATSSPFHTKVTFRRCGSFDFFSSGSRPMKSWWDFPNEHIENSPRSRV